MHGCWLGAQTLALIFRGVCSKNFNNFTFDIIDLLTGIDVAEQSFKVSPPQTLTLRPRPGICSLRT